jgi:hypothetical protein
LFVVPALYLLLAAQHDNDQTAWDESNRLAERPGALAVALGADVPHEERLPV